MTFASFLEWGAYGGVLVSSWLYGSKSRFAAPTGALSAAIFILYGIYCAIPAASITNVAFLAVHIRNWVKFNEK